MPHAVQDCLASASREYRMIGQVCIELGPGGVRYFLRQSELDGIAGFFHDSLDASTNVKVEENADRAEPPDCTTLHVITLNNCDEDIMELFLCWLPNYSFADLRSTLNSMTHEDRIESSRMLVERLVKGLVFGVEQRIPDFVTAAFKLLIRTFQRCSPSCLTVDVVRNVFACTPHFGAIRQLVVREVIWTQTSNDGHVFDVNDFHSIEGFYQIHATEMAKALSEANKRGTLPMHWSSEFGWYELCNYTLPNCDLVMV